jgi:hypothetical protein
VNSYEDRELARELQALAAQIQVPSGSLPTHRGRTLGRAPALAGAVAVLVAAIAVGAAINNLRTERDDSSTVTRPPASASSAPSPSGAMAFPDYPLLAGTMGGLVYRIQGGQVSGSPVDVCEGQTVLALQPSSSGRFVLAICGGHPPGEARAIVLDAITLTRQAGPVAVVPRSDVAAWAPDEHAVALLQTGRCDPDAPVCSVHVLLWDLASGTTRLIRPDEPLTYNVRWTVLGLSISLPQAPQTGTFIWDGQTWNRYSTHALWIADAGGRALLVETSTGNLGGRVWEATGGQEVALTSSGTEYPLGLDGDRAIVWRDTPFSNSGAVVVYRGQREERQVPAELCLSAQQIDRWLVCTSSGSAALAYSLDGNAFARQAIAGLAGRFYVLAALPKSSQGATPAIVSRQAAIQSVRGLTVEVRRVDRIEAKLVSASSSPAWLVAVSGDIGCNCIIDLSFRSAVYTIDAQTGTIRGVTKTSETWPASFDSVADESGGR